MVAGGGPMVNVLGVELTPSPLTTWMEAVPCAARNAAGTIAVMEVAVRYEESSRYAVSEPLGVHVTEDRFVNPLPAMFTVVSPLSAPMEAGERPLPLLTTGAASMVKAPWAEVVLSAFTTVTATDPGAAIMLWLIGQVRLVALTNCVEDCCVPFHAIFAPETNPLPCTVSVNGALRPTVA